MAGRTRAGWENNRAGTVLAFVGGLLFTVFGIWSLVARPETQQGGSLPVPVSVIFIVVGIGIVLLVGRELIAQFRHSTDDGSQQPIARSELPAPLAAALSAIERRSNHLPAGRQVRIDKLVRIDDTTVAWHWHGVQRRTKTMAVAVTASEPFATPVATSAYVPGPLRRLSGNPGRLVGLDLDRAEVAALDGVVSVATPEGAAEALDADKRIWPVLLATLPTRAVEALDAELQGAVPAGHDEVPFGLMTVIGFAEGTTVLLLLSSTSLDDRLGLLAVAERIEPYL